MRQFPAMSTPLEPVFGLRGICYKVFILTTGRGNHCQYLVFSIFHVVLEFFHFPISSLAHFFNSSFFSDTFHSSSLLSLSFWYLELSPFVTKPLGISNNKNNHQGLNAIARPTTNRIQNAGTITLMRIPNGLSIQSGQFIVPNRKTFSFL